MKFVLVFIHHFYSDKFRIMSARLVSARFFFCSLLFHSVLFLLLFWRLFSISTIYKNEDVALSHQVHVWPKITAYLYHKKGVNYAQASEQNFYNTAAKALLSANIKPIALPQKPTPAEFTAAKINDKLLLILHDLIQKNVQYPRGVDVTIVSKETQVGFNLYPDGHIGNIEIVSSSGVKILDMVAFNAVQMLPSIELAETLLGARQHFVVPVVFRRI